MVIPSWDVSVDVNVTVPNIAGDLDADLRLHPWVINQDHFPIRPGDWDVTEATIAAEAAVVANADEHTETFDEFEAMLQAAERDGIGEDWYGLDLGVAGLVMALNAAGFATASSCRKHPADPWADCPFVIATGDVDRIALLRPLALETSAGASDGPQGDGFGIYAASVRPLMALALLIVKHRAVFDAIPAPIGWDQDAYEAETDW